MTHPSIADNDPPRRNRARRREAMINAIATILGCLALVVMIATVIRVVMVKLWESAKVNPEYAQSVYDHEMERHRSENNHERPFLPSDRPHSSNNLPRVENSSILPKISLPQAATPSADSAQSATAPPSAIQDIDSKRPQIERALRGFFEAESLETRLAFVRDPQRVAPLMENYYRSHPRTSLAWKNLGWVLPVEEPGYRLGYAQAIFADAESVSLIIEEVTDGAFRVDWESSVRYGELDWDEFIKTQPAAPTLFRVVASKPQNTPSASIPQDSEVLEIRHPDNNNVIYAYFDRRDPKLQPLLQQLQTGNWKDVPLTLRLCYAGPTGIGKSARIADVEGKGWLILHGTRS